MDRRTVKTQKAVFEALTALLEKKNFDSITVGDIADVADINRVTIYKHFADKYDVLDKCIDYHVSAFLADCNEGQMEELTLHAFRYLKEKRRTFQLLLNAAGPGVLHEKFAASFREREYHHHIAKEPTHLRTEIKTEMLISALAGVFEWWLTASEDYSAEEACESFVNVVYEFAGGSSTRDTE